LLASSGAQSVVEKWGNMDEDSGLEGVRGGGLGAGRDDKRGGSEDCDARRQLERQRGVQDNRGG
jgi:hypothetical protein